jgi:uncharacterized protein DUF4055
MSEKKKKDPRDPSTTSEAYDHMVPSWRKIDTLLGGTEAMRRAEKEYLPPHEAEGRQPYKERLGTNVLFNLTEITLDTWVGRPFSRPVKVSDDVPAEIVQDVNLKGDSLSVFSREWFRCGLSKSYCHVLVDHPRVARDPDRPRTLEDDLREKLRPYWVIIPPENLIFARSTLVNGKEVLTHARVLEEVVVPDGFGERTVRRIKVFEPGLVTAWEERPDPKNRRKMVWVPVEQILIDLPQVPIVTFYANRTGFMTGKSPLVDLADLNIRWWQSNSDQQAILTVTRFPLLAGSGQRPLAEDGKEAELVVGPFGWLWNYDPQGKFYYVEHTGKAIQAGREELLDLEERMMTYGAQFLRKRKGGETATARALDSAEATSPLQDATVRFVDKINEALFLSAKWLGLDDAEAAKWVASIDLDFGPEIVEAADFQALVEARKNRDVSRPSFLGELKRRGTLSGSFDPEKNDQELQAELAEFSGSPTDGKAIDEAAEE